VPVRSAASSYPAIWSHSQPSPPNPLPCHWTTVRFRSCHCPTSPAHAAGQLSDFIRGAVQRGWNLPWNQSVHRTRPIGGDFPRFQVQPDRIGQSATNSKSLYTGMTPHPPVQIPCPIRDDAGVTMPGNIVPTAGAVLNVSCNRQDGAPRSWPSHSRRWRKGTIEVVSRVPRLDPRRWEPTCISTSGTGTGPYPGLLAKPALDPRFAPVSSSEWPRLAFLQLRAIPVHGYDIESCPVGVPGGANWRQDAELSRPRSCARWAAPAGRRLARIVVAGRKRWRRLQSWETPVRG